MNISFQLLYDAWVKHETLLMQKHKFNQNKNSKDYIPNFREAVCAYWDWQSTIISDKHYSVFESVEIKNTIITLPKRYQDSYLAIKDRLKNGESVLCYQRHTEEQLHYKKNYLYTHWGIQHLHLHNNQKKLTSEYIIFLKIQDNNVYFLSIANHGQKGLQKYLEFYNPELLTIIDNNWSNLLIYLNLPVTRQYCQVTSEQIKNTQQGRWNTIYQINGKAILPNIGVNSAGGTIKSVTRYNTVIGIIKQLERIINTKFTEKIYNTVIETIPIGCKSGAVIFDSYQNYYSFMLLHKSARDDFEFMSQLVSERLNLDSMTLETKNRIIEYMRETDEISFLIYSNGTVLYK